MVKQWILIALIFLFLSGCICEKEIKIEYIKQNPYEFSKVDTQGMSIDAKSKEIQKLCTPIVVETGTIYRKIIDFYDWQIDEYKKVVNDDNKTRY